MSQEVERQMEILAKSTTMLTNNQFELLAAIKACGERINILVERADIHMNIIEDLRLQIKMLEAHDATPDRDKFMDTHSHGRVQTLARKARQQDDQ